MKIGCADIASEILEEVSHVIQSNNISPCLAVILAGNNHASEIYVKRKKSHCEKHGIRCDVYLFDEKVEQLEIELLIKKLNDDPNVSGILVQLPLPPSLLDHTQSILNCINPQKDVDCFHAFNIGAIAQRSPTFLPCTPAGIIYFLEYHKIPIVGQHFVIINDSIVVGRPLAFALGNMGATVTLCNKDTINIKQISRSADVLVVAVGKYPNFVLTSEYCKKGVVVIDVGINKVNGKVIGDVDESVSEVASLATKVPGGIGLLTIAMLLKNVVKSALLNDLHS